MIQCFAATFRRINIQTQRFTQFGLSEVLRQPPRTQGVIHRIIVGFLGVERASIHHSDLTIGALVGSKKSMT